jgi:hypothetical protein
MATYAGKSILNAVRLGLVASSIAVVSAAMVGCSDPTVSYNAEVAPVLEKRCMECHQPGGKGYEQSGLDMTSHAALMRGTRFGPIVEPGEPLNSVLNQLVEGRADPSIKMPHGRDSLPDQEIALLREWVAQGASNN